MKLRNKSHTLILIVVALSGCASQLPPADVRLQHHYAPMVAQAQQAQPNKPDTQPTSQPRQMILNTQGRAIGYIK